MTRAPLVRLGIRVRRERAESALAALRPILQAGAEETAPAGGEVEYAVYAPRAELPALDRVRALAGDALVDATLTDAGHEHLRPVEVAAGGRRLRVRPPWQPPAAEAGVPEIVIDPGALFGAGTHPTTQLCLELLLELDAGGPLCDWGAGSGILAIAAARLGFTPVEAVELTPAGLEAISVNAAANGVGVLTRWLDLATTPAPWAPTVTANLSLELLETIAARALTEPTSSAGTGERAPERMIASGVPAARAGAVGEAFARHGLREARRRVRGEWAAVLLTRPTLPASTGERP